MSTGSRLPPAPRDDPDDPGDAARRERARRERARREARRERARRRRVATGRRERRRRLAALTVLAVLVVVIAATLALLPGSTQREHGHAARAVSRRAPPHEPGALRRPTSYAVGIEVQRLVEPGRTVTYGDGDTERRALEMYIRYPAAGPSGATDVAGAPPARADGPFPLVVFGHGYEEAPQTYRLLLQSWARAGFVVAAPAFPGEDADAPGGTNEADLVNEPGDVRAVISRILVASASGRGRLAGLVNASEVAVTGQSDGGDNALAVGYGDPDRDPRVQAVIVLSGAEGPFREHIRFTPGSPPMLATQGSEDPINHPWETTEFFRAARRPKYLLSLEGASHLPPYTEEQPQLETVERVTITFLYAYLEHRSQALRRLASVGNVSGVATLTADAPSS